MSASEVIIDELALAAVSKCINTYRSEMHAAITEAVKSLNSHEGEWGDDDFRDLVASVSAFLNDIDNMDSATNQLMARIETKLEAIQTLHSMKI